MLQVASFKIICTDSSKILFSQILVKSFFELSLAKTKFFHLPLLCGGYLISIAYRLFSFLVWGPWKGSKGQISFNFNYKVNFKDFYTNFVCVLTNERYKIYQTGFSLCRLGHAPAMGLWGTGGLKFIFFKHGHVAYQMDGYDKQSRIQVKFSSKGQTGDLGVRSKGQILNFSYHVNFKDFYTKLCVYSNK